MSHNHTHVFSASQWCMGPQVALVRQLENYALAAETYT